MSRPARIRSPTAAESGHVSSTLATIPATALVTRSKTESSAATTTQSPITSQLYVPRMAPLLVGSDLPDSDDCSAPAPQVGEGTQGDTGAVSISPDHQPGRTGPQTSSLWHMLWLLSMG